MRKAKEIISISCILILLFVSCFYGKMTTAAAPQTTEVTNIHIRHDSGRLLLFLSVNDYADKSATQIAGDKVSEYNVFDKILVYKSDTEYQTLRDLIDDKTYYNIWSEYGCVAFDMADGWDGTTVKKVVIQAGCEFPSFAYTNAGGTEKDGYVVEKDTTFITTSSKIDNTNWIKEATLVKEDTEVFGIKSGHNAEIVTFTLTNSDYEGLANEWVGDSHISYNYMDQIKLYTSETEFVTLADAYKNQRYYCMWTEKNTLSLQLEKDVFDELVKIEIPADTAFPSYAYTNQGGADKIGYVTSEPYVFKKPAMPTSGQVYEWILVKEKEETDTRISNIHVRYANGGKLLVFLDTHDYPDNVATKVIDKLDEYDILDHILLYRGDEEKTLAEVWAGGEKYYNIWAEKGCVAFSLADGWNGETITKVVIQEDCEFPSYEYTTQGGKKLKMFVAKYETVFTASQQAEQNVFFERNEKITTIPVATEVTEAKLLGTKGDVRLVISLSEHDYKQAGDNAALESKFMDYNTLSNIVLYDGSKEYKLSDIIREDEVYCNLWGKENSVSFGLNGDFTTESFDKLVIKAGCEFPSYLYAATDADEKKAYVVAQDGTWNDLQDMYQVTYYNEAGDVLYRDQVACGTAFAMRAVPDKKGYVASWEGTTYAVMPAQDISYVASYDQVKVNDEPIIEEPEEEPEDESEEPEEEKKSPATGHYTVGTETYYVLMLLAVALIALQWKRRTGE